MNNVRSFPNDAQFIRDNAEIDREAENPGPTNRRVSTLQLKRRAATLLRAIRKEEKRQEAEARVMILQRKLADTLAAGTTLTYI